MSPTGHTTPPSTDDELPELTATELSDRLEASEPLVLVDVRQPFEMHIADLPEVGQLRIPMNEFAERTDELDPDAEMVLYCRSGARSGRATRYLLGLGFKSVWNLKGGVLAWREEVDPSLERY